VKNIWIRKYYLTGLIAIGAAALLTSCSSGPEAPAKGTPAFYWQAAKETQAGGDMANTNDHLSKLLRGENEFAGKAQVWKLVLASGMAKGYMEYADAFEFGARANKTNQMQFRKQVSDLRGGANALALEVAEVFGNFQQKNKDAEVVLAFPFPSASPAMVAQVAKVSTGAMLPSDEIESGLKNVLKRSVMMAACGATGSKEDVAKAQDMFKAGEVKVPRAVFVQYMAGVLYDQSQLYTELKLSNPERMKIFVSKADEALKTVPESKESKELAAKIEAAQKKMKK
jgi:hypothetical protein